MGGGGAVVWYSLNVQFYFFSEGPRDLNAIYGGREPTRISRRQEDCRGKREKSGQSRRAGGAGIFVFAGRRRGEGELWSGTA